MKRIFLISIIILLQLKVVAQGKLFPTTYQYPDVVNGVLNQLKLYGKENLYNLIPFTQDDKWGYLDKNNLKIIIKPIAHRTTFYQEKEYHVLLEIKNNKELFGIIQRNGGLKIITLGPPQVMAEPPMPRYERPANSNANIVSSKNGFKGFTYIKDSAGRYQVSSYSDLYKSSYKSFPNLSLIEIDGKVHGIAEKNKEKSNQRVLAIIDEKGNALKDFDFKYTNIIPLTGYDKRLGHWFLVLEEGADNFQLKNSDGKVLTHNGTTEANFQIGFYAKPEETPYYTAVEHNLNYVVMNNRIFDTYNLRWVDTKIPNSYKLFHLSYLLPNKPPKTDLSLLRQNAEFYVWVENMNGDRFYIDFEGKEYAAKLKTENK